MPEQHAILEFDFDHWARLARDNPAAFESARNQAIEAAIGRALPARQRRLRGLQWQLDQIRRTAGTPLQACLTMNRLMLESVYGDNGLLARLQQMDALRRRLAVRKSAEILPFQC